TTGPRSALSILAAFASAVVSLITVANSRRRNVFYGREASSETSMLRRSERPGKDADFCAWSGLEVDASNPSGGRRRDEQGAVSNVQTLGTVGAAALPR